MGTQANRIHIETFGCGANRLGDVVVRDNLDLRIDSTLDGFGRR